MQNESMYGAFAVIKGVLTALVISVLFSIFFAVVLRVAPVPDKAVYPVNQTVKVLAAFLGALFFVRGEKGWRKGLLVVFRALVRNVFHGGRYVCIIAARIGGACFYGAWRCDRRDFGREFATLSAVVFL